VKTHWKRPFCIGIAGPSCSGKTSIAHRLAALLPGNSAIFGLDSYYTDLSHLRLAERRKFNFDRPDALEGHLLAEHLQALSRGQAIQRPIFDFTTHTRMHNCFDEIRPGDFLIVEGLFTFHWPQVRRIFDFRAFVVAPDAVCFERRKARDVQERGYRLEFVLAQYQTNVRSGNENFISPTRQFADLVISGEQPIEESARQLHRLVEGRLRGGRE
jgi:uridine kinase